MKCTPVRAAKGKNFLSFIVENGLIIVVLYTLYKIHIKKNAVRFDLRLSYSFSALEKYFDV